MKIYDIPRTNLFVQKLYWADRRALPGVSRERAQETEYPFRHGTAYALRLPLLRTAPVMGRWEGRKREKEGLLAAMGGRVTQDNGEDINQLEYLE